MEYGTFGFGVMVFGQDHLLLRIGTAYGRTVAVAALNNLSGTNALNPGHFMGMFFVGRSPYLTFVGPGGTQYSFIVKAGYHILELSVTIVIRNFGSNAS